MSYNQLRLATLLTRLYNVLRNAPSSQTFYTTLLPNISLGLLLNAQSTLLLIARSTKKTVKQTPKNPSTIIKDEGEGEGECTLCVRTNNYTFNTLQTSPCRGQRASPIAAALSTFLTTSATNRVPGQLPQNAPKHRLDCWWEVLVSSTASLALFARSFRCWRESILMNTGAWRKCLPLALYFASHTQWHAACFLSFFYNLSRKEKEWSKIEWIMEKSDIDRQRNTRKLGMGKKHIFKGYPHIPVSNVLSSHSSPDWSAVVGLCWGGRKKKTLRFRKKTSPPRVCKVESLVREVNFFLRVHVPRW